MRVVKPEEAARKEIDAALERAGWVVQAAGAANVHAGPGVAVCEFPLKHGYGTADYLLYVNGQVVGVVEAKPAGTTLTGVEPQAEKYSVGLPDYFPAPVRPLPFLYQSTGVETRFTNGLDPDPRSRRVFSFHRPGVLAEWAGLAPGLRTLKRVAEGLGDYRVPATLRARLQTMPPLDDRGLWPAQAQAIRNLERSLQADRPRALIQMATGSGKTVMSIAAIYRLIKYAGARRVLFLVDRLNLGRQALGEFQQYVTPDDGRKFTELYNVQLLTSNRIDEAARVVITTIQRLYSILKGEPELDPALEEASQFDAGAGLVSEPPPVVYNPAIPIETFDVIFTDECHRSIYHLWRQVLEYFDAYLIGLTATPSKQTLGFFNQNLVMEYSHEQAVADAVNVDFNVYRIRTQITEQGSTIEASMVVDFRDRATRKVRWDRLDEALTYGANELDRDVVAPDQIRTVLQVFKDKLFTEIFPGRTEVPKTLIYAKDDSHADDIVQIAREVFGKGNEFVQKITYKTGTARIVTQEIGPDGHEVEQVSYKSSGLKAEDLLSSFRNSYNPRIVVTVDMIATGTDIKPLEIVMFMRAVRSRTFFEQMKGRGVRVIDEDTFRSVTPDARNKTHFVIVDCVGVCERELMDSPPLDRKPFVSFDRLLRAVAFGSADPELLSSLAARLVRLDRQLDEPERQALAELAGGQTIRAIAGDLVAALDPDRQVEAARELAGLPVEAEPSAEEVKQATVHLLKQAVAPLATNPALRERLSQAKQRLEQVIDTVSKDQVLEADYSEAARQKAEQLVKSFREFIEANKDEITALQVLYSRPYARRLRYSEVKALAQAMEAPPRQWTTETLWRAYETLDRSKVRGSGRRVLADIVALVRYALQAEDELVPFPEQVEARYRLWLTEQERLGRGFTPEQREWLDLIKDHIGANLQIDLDDFEYAPFAQRGGAGRAYQVFGPDFERVLDELNEVLAA